MTEKKMKRDTEDLIGKEVGSLTVLSIATKKDKGGHTFYNCVCKCGSERVVRRSSLKTKQTVSCGNCWTKKDFSGLKFKSFTVISYSHSEKDHKYWNCKCDCGRDIVLATYQLNTDKPKTCGIGHYRGNKNHLWGGYKDISGAYLCNIKRRAAEAKLEFSITPEYIWKIFEKQQGKCALSGVDICFAQSLTSDRESQTASLDRIDSKKGYIKNNVQWLHKDVNKMKMDMPQEDFVEICRKIVRNKDNG